MNVSDTIPVGGLELNTVGVTYLLANLNSQLSNTAYYIDGHQSLTATIPAQTTLRFYILDFTWVPTVSTWTRHDDLLAQSTTWTYGLGGPRFNLTYGPRSPEGPLLKTFIAIYNPSFTLTVPANAWSDGSIVSFDRSTPSEILMPLLIGISLVVLVTTVALDRNLTSTQRARKKKR